MPLHCDACGRRVKYSGDLGVICGPCQEREERERELAEEDLFGDVEDDPDAPF